jgi:diguanylate cyclase (GGDEF)-like protein
MTKTTQILSPARLDPYLLDRLAVIHRVCLGVAASIALVVLAGWLSPAFDHFLPEGWMLMKLNTAVCSLLVALGFLLSQCRRTARQLAISRILAVVVALIAVATLVEYAFHMRFGIDTLLAADTISSHPGRMAPQTAACFTLLAAATFQMRWTRQPAARAADLLVFILAVLLLVMLSGYVFGALHLYGLTLHTRASPQTLVVLSFLVFVAFGRRAEYGGFGIMLEAGFGSRFARLAWSPALFLPLLLELARAAAIKAHWLSPEYATAIATSMATVVAFGVILVLAWRIDGLQREISELSLRDELTRLYNRRGFYLMAEQALRLSLRSAAPFCLLFIDVDNLKQINDSLGHEAGSACLRELADLLMTSFRKTDVIGRVGGDEFIVAGECSEDYIRQMAKKLELAAVLVNSKPDREYALRVSYGHASTEKDDTRVTLDALIGTADRRMYHSKRQKKMAAQ